MLQGKKRIHQITFFIHTHTHLDIILTLFPKSATHTHTHTLHATVFN